MTMPAPLTLGWRARPGISFLRGDATDVHVGPVDAPLVALRPPSPALADSLAALADGVGETELSDRIQPSEVARFHYMVGKLVNAGMVMLDVLHSGQRLASLIPRRRNFVLPTQTQPSNGGLTLSRFAYLRRVDADLILAAPDATCDVVVGDGRARAWVTACVPVSPSDHELPPERSAFLQLLHGVGLLDDDGEAESDATGTWEFHDRLFHRAVRSYDDHVVRGGTYRFSGSLARPPATSVGHAGRVVTLDRPPDPSSSSTLAAVMESRRSRRAMSTEPVTVAEVGELLFRVARTTEAGGGADPHIRRPYPSGGARHELEFYLAVGSCHGLEPGFHHYRGDDHTLVALGAGDETAAMLEDCAQAWGQPGEPPQVLVVISSRLPRLAWTYQGIAYKLSLLNAGVAIGNLYLVATDMGLAGSAAGSGNPDLFASATGADPWEETSIAEFGFGRAGD